MIVIARTAKRYKNENHIFQENKSNIPSYSVGIYSRISVEKVYEKSESIEHQIEIIKQFILENNENPKKEMELFIYDIYIDSGTSGTSFERNAFEKMIQDVKEQKVNCIIVKDLSRFGRNYLETGNFIEKILPCLGCRFIAIADHFDSMSEQANEHKFIMNIKNLVNDMYTKDISQKVSASKKTSAKNGSYIGGFAPYGYEIVSVQGIRKLQINTECAQIVQDIFTLYANESSIREIVLELYAKKIHSINDYKKYGHVSCENTEILNQWSEASISRILQNTNYLGNPHPAIISRELFEKAQNRKNQKKSENKLSKQFKDTENIYRNILYCGCCKKIMHSSCYQSKTKEKRSYAYYCPRAYLIDERKCEKNYIREESLTVFILNQKIVVNHLTMLKKIENEKEMQTYLMEEKKVSREINHRKKQSALMYKKYKEDMISDEEYHIFQQKKKEQDFHAKIKQENLLQKIKEIKNSQKLILTRQLIESSIEHIYIFPDGNIDIIYKLNNKG